MVRDVGLADSRHELSQHPGSVMPEKMNQGPDMTSFIYNLIKRCTVAQWLALSPKSQKVDGSILGLGAIL